MAQNYIKPGRVIEVKVADGTKSGQAIKVGQLVGVALADIPAGFVGSVQLCGVFELPKVADAALTFGTQVYLDASGLISATESATPAGMVLQDAAANAATVPVLINGLPG